MPPSRLLGSDPLVVRDLRAARIGGANLADAVAQVHAKYPHLDRAHIHAIATRESEGARRVQLFLDWTTQGDLTKFQSFRAIVGCPEGRGNVRVNYTLTVGRGDGEGQKRFGFAAELPWFGNPIASLVGAFAAGVDAARRAGYVAREARDYYREYSDLTNITSFECL